MTTNRLSTIGVVLSLLLLSGAARVHAESESPGLHPTSDAYLIPFVSEKCRSYFFIEHVPSGFQLRQVRRAPEEITCRVSVLKGQIEYGADDVEVMFLQAVGRRDESDTKLNWRVFKSRTVGWESPEYLSAKVIIAPKAKYLRVRVMQVGSGET